jgi:hypothetical protein
MNSKKTEKKEITLDDVTPLHPHAYPGKHLKDKLDARHETLSDIKDHAASEGLEKDELS